MIIIIRQNGLEVSIIYGLAQYKIVLTRHDRPVLIVRSLLDDDALDNLIAQHPAFLASIRRARQQKARGQVRRLSELRQKYNGETVPVVDKP